MKDFVSFEIAVKLKEKGFDKFCENGYFLKSGIEYSVPNNDSVLVSSIGEIIFNAECCWFEEEIEYGRDIIYAPTISQVLKWFRENKCVNVIVTLWNSGWYVDIQSFTKEEDEEGVAYEVGYIFQSPDYETYEQAAIAGIEYVLDNLL